MIHVYAFAERLEDVPPVEGLAGAPVERLRVEDVDAVFSRRAGETSCETLRRDALAHGTVVEALRTRAAAVVPVRFGELLADEAALKESLRERLPALRGALERVRDCVEVAVRVYDGAEPEGERPASGSDYMRLRAAAESRRRESVEGLHRQLAGLARDVRVEHRVGVERERLSAAYLVASGRVGHVRSAVERFAASHAELTVVCTGPWAPFSFVGDAA